MAHDTLASDNGAALAIWANHGAAVRDNESDRLACW